MLLVTFTDKLIITTPHKTEDEVTDNTFNHEGYWKVCYLIWPIVKNNQTLGFYKSRYKKQNAVKPTLF